MKFIDFNNNTHIKRIVGIILVLLSTPLFFYLNRVQKLGTIKEELFASASRKGECFQGFCLGGDPEATLISRWLTFSFEYMELVLLGMIFAFAISGIVEAFIFPRKNQTMLFSPGLKGIFRGYILGPALNLCSACIVPVVNSLKNKGSSLESVIALTQGSSTLNFLSIIMIFTIFTPDLGWNRIITGAISVFLFGPIIARLTFGWKLKKEKTEQIKSINIEDNISFKNSMKEGLFDFGKITFSNVIKLGPIMIIAGFAAGLVIQFLSPGIIDNYLGNNLKGIIIASTIGVLINVPLLFEIPLVVALLLLGMGVAPAATLLFTAASGGPITYWGLSKVLPKISVTYYALMIWILGISTGLISLLIININNSGISGGIKLTDNQPIIRESKETINSIQTTKTELKEPEIITNILKEHTITQKLLTKENDNSNFDIKYFKQLDNETLKGPMEVWNYRPGVVIFDFDRDNDMDFFITNGTEYSNILYLNNSDGTFTNIANEAGLGDKKLNGSGAVACDINNDGFQDLYIGARGFNGDGLDFRSQINNNNTEFIGIEDRLFLNMKNGQFKDITRKAFKENLNYRSASSIACADINNDGYLDLYVTNLIDEDFFMSSLFWPSHPGHYNLLYKNNGDLTFDEIAKEAGINGPQVIMLNPEGKEIIFKDKSDKEYMGYNPDVKDKNLNRVGDPTGPTHAAAFFDHDEDGDQDLWVASDGDQLHIYRNDSANGKILFTHISKDMGLDIIGNWMGFAISDFNNDGKQDVFITNAGPHSRIITESMPSPKPKPGGDCKYHEKHNLGTCLHSFLINKGIVETDNNNIIPKFEEFSEKTNVIPSPFMPAEAAIKTNIKPGMNIPLGIGAYDFGYGVTAFDFNNDTIKDIYWIGSEVGRGEGPGGNVYPSAGRMLQGKPDFSYEDITIRSRLLDIQGINYNNYFNNLEENIYPDNKYNLKYKVHTKYHENGKGLAHGDLNGDGYVDLIATNSSGPVWSGTLDDAGGPFYVWINGGGKNNWINLKLTGRMGIDNTGSNSDGIGAKVYLIYKDKNNQKSIQMQEVIAGSSYLSMDSTNLEFGLSDIEIIDEIRIIWPSGIIQKLYSINVNQHLDIIEIKK